MSYSKIPSNLSLGLPLFLTNSKEIVYFAYRHDSDIIVIHLNEGVRTYTAHDITEFTSVPNRMLDAKVKSKQNSIQFGWFYLKDEVEQYPKDFLSKYIKYNQTYMLWYFLHLFHAEIPKFDIINLVHLKSVIISNLTLTQGLIYSGFGIILNVEFSISNVIYHKKFLYPLYIDSVPNLGDLNVMVNFIFDLGESFIFKEGITISNPSINASYTKHVTLNEWK